jgi:hypothetical protein
LKCISGETFEIQLAEDNSTVIFKGALRLTGMEDYAPILAMLKETLTDVSAAVVIDMRELDFLNSSGITMFSRFVIEARNRTHIGLQFIASETIPWQARSLKNLQRLMPAIRVELI